MRRLDHSSRHEPSTPSAPSQESLRQAFFLIGPTAVGKSAVAQHIAEEERWDILSTDSMLIYKGMDIGTAKPAKAERKDVRYWGLDLAEPVDSFSVGMYVEAVKGAFDSGRPVLAVGGTGLYVRCLVQGLAPLPGSDDAIRANAEKTLREDGLAALQRMVRDADPIRYEALADKLNPRRLIRALEVAGHGSNVSRTWTKEQLAPMAGLRMEPSLLHRRIEERVHRMYESGLMAEVEEMRERHGTLSPTAMQAIGYAEALAVLEGRMSERAAMEKTIVRTRQLAKRQMTWFRHQANVEWIDVEPRSSVESLADEVRQIWRKHGPIHVHI